MSIASSTTGVSRSTWARPATSGTTPPKRACRSTWLDTTELLTIRPSSTTAAAVSSHEVSMARIRIGRLTTLGPAGAHRGPVASSTVVPLMADSMAASRDS